MRRSTCFAAAAAALMLLVGIGTLVAEGDAAGRHDVLYTCGCSPECACGSVSLAAGTCSCGKPLVWGHVVKVEGSDALVCRCAEGCTCALDKDNPGSCACGKPLHRASLKGSGIYFCNCGGSCTCNHLSAAPGTCACGMTLKKVDA